MAQNHVTPGTNGGLKGRLQRWFAERYDVEQIGGALSKQSGKRLPRSVGWAHTLGSLSLFLFLSQIVTGILLLVYYRAAASEAFQSVKYITTQVHFGWLFRQLHAWGGQLMILIVLLHMIRTYFAGAYKKPRELTWLVGVLIFFCVLTFGFTGYLLPWNQLAYWATTVGTEVAGAVPWVGDFIRTLLRGGKAVGAETLSRFFTVHVIVLPWVLFALVAAHLVLVRTHNLTQKARVGEEPPVDQTNGIPFFPHHVAKEGVVLMVLIGVLITLAILLPFDLGEPADPLNTPHGIKPEWYFLSTYQMLKYFPDAPQAVAEAFPPAKLILFPFIWWPKPAGLVLSALPFLLLFLWPFLDRNPERKLRKRPVAVGAGVLAILLLVAFGILGHLSESRRSIFGTEYEFDVRGVPHRVGPEAAESPLEAPPGAEHKEPEEAR